MHAQIHIGTENSPSWLGNKTFVQTRPIRPSVMTAEINSKMKRWIPSRVVHTTAQIPKSCSTYSYHHGVLYHVPRYLSTAQLQPASLLGASA